MKTLKNSAFEVDNFWNDISAIDKIPYPRLEKKQKFIEELLPYRAHINHHVEEFAKFGLFMAECKTRKAENPRVATMLRYVSLIKPVSLILQDQKLKNLNELELIGLFEEVQDIKGINNHTNSALLNLFTYLNEIYEMPLSNIELAIFSDGNVDKNLLWERELNAILSSDELSDEEKLFVLTLYETGARITEVYQLIAEDMDWIAKTLHLRTNRLGKKKNRYSTRVIPFSTLTVKLISQLLFRFQAISAKSPLFDFDDEVNKQHNCINFCSSINRKIKKITGRHVTLKHLRHSRARIRHLNIKEPNSLRCHMQNTAYLGHSNLATGQKHYIQSVYENNIVVPMSDEVTAKLLCISIKAIHQRRSRHRKAKPDCTMSNEVLNAYLSL
jgi:integrase